MKNLFSTTCIPADAGQKKRPFLHRFIRNEDGNVTVVSITLIAITALLAGVSWDMNNFEYHRVKIQQLADRAVLAAADLDQQQDPKKVVQDYFDKANYPDLVASIGHEEDVNFRRVSVAVEGVVETGVLRGDYTGGVKRQGSNLVRPEMVNGEEVYAAGATTQADNWLTLHAFSEAEERIENVEISLVLDISGSMGQTSDKMQNLRDAASTFVDSMINDATEDRVSISIVPYSEHVSAGKDLMDQFRVDRTHSYSYCIEFDHDDFDHTKIGASADGNSKRYDQVQHFYWGTTSYNNRTDPVCPDGEHEDIVVFSQDDVALKNKISQLVPRGSTSIFAGMKWAAGLLDPSFQPVNQNLSTTQLTDLDRWGRQNHNAPTVSDPAFDNRPVAYGDPETLKTVILMTDGQNHYSKRITSSVYANSSHWAHWNNNNFDWWVNRNVYYNNRSAWSSSKYWPSYGDSLLSNVCDAAKANNIVIWSVGFEVTDHGANVMRDCASSPSHFFRVEGVEITEAFSAIARQINQLRLTQ